MILKKRIRVYSISLALSLGLPQTAPASHYLGHVPGEDEPDQQQQIEEFCKVYPTKDKKFQKEKEKAYQQYCKSQSKPKLKKEQAQIDRIRAPQCLEAGSTIKVHGQLLKKHGLKCRLEAQGKQQSLQPNERNDDQFSYRIDRLPEDTDYAIACEIESDRDKIKVKACPSTSAVSPAAPAGDEASSTDLIPEFDPPEPKPGQNQAVSIEVRNLGRSQPQNQPYWVDLALTTHDLSRGIGLTQGVTGDSQILARGRGRLNRVPGAGQSEQVRVSINLPDQLPDTLFWCAFADSDGRQFVPEFNENNNLVCTPAGGEMATGLTGVFGRAVRNRTVDVEVDEDRIPEGVEIQNPEFATLYMLALRLNDNVIQSVVERNGVADLHWEFPPSSELDEIYLRIKRGEIGETDPLCPPEGTPLAEGESLLEGWDGGDLGWPGRGRIVIGPNRIIYDDRNAIYNILDFEPAHTYSFVACGIQTAGDSPVFMHESNVVKMQYAFPTAVTEVAESACIVPMESDPITELEILSVTGDTRSSLGQDPVPTEDVADLVGEGNAFFNLAVEIRNSGARPASVRVGYRTRRPREGASASFDRNTLFAGDIVAGPSVIIEPGATTTAYVRYAFAAEASLAYPESNQSEVLLLNALVGDLENAMWQDRNVCDNRTWIRVPYPEFEHYQVSAELTRVHFNRSCDAVSRGDWFFDLTVRSLNALDGPRGTATSPVFNVQRGDDIVFDSESAPRARGYYGKDTGEGDIQVRLQGWDCDHKNYDDHKEICKNQEETGEVSLYIYTADGGISQRLFSKESLDPEGRAFDPDTEHAMPNPVHNRTLGRNKCRENSYNAWIKIRTVPYFGEFGDL